MANKRDDAELVEFIVQEVIRRLTATSIAAVGTTAVPATAHRTGRELVVDERLITLATLNGRLEGVRRVVVTNKALLTPAVYDELRDRGIEVHKK